MYIAYWTALIVVWSTKFTFVRTVEISERVIAICLGVKKTTIELSQMQEAACVMLRHTHVRHVRGA